MNTRREDEREAVWRDFMVAAQAGDRGLYEKLLLELLPLARRQVGWRIADPGAREDVVQNVFVSLHRARHTYRPEQPFLPWFHAIVRNAVIDWGRARGRRAAQEVAYDPETMPEPVAPPTTDDALSPELERALATLPPAQREAVEWIHIEGLSVAEAAARAGVSAGALKVRAHRGYRALRARLGTSEERAR